MAVEVVGRDVGHQRYVGADLQGLELKARELHDHPAGGRHVFQLAEQWSTDIAADEDVPLGCFEYLAYQARRRAFACAAGDAHDRRRTEREEQLDQAAQANPARPRSLQQLVLGRHAWRGVHHVHVGQVVDGMSTEPIRDRRSVQLSHGVGELIRWLLIGDGHAGAVAGEKPGEIDAFARQPDHQRALTTDEVACPLRHRRFRRAQAPPPAGR